MLGYNILCALGAIVGTLLFCGSDISLFSIAACVILLFFYSLFSVGFLPTYWSLKRDLKERVGVIVANSTIVTTMFAFANIISSILDSGSRVAMAGSMMGASIVMNMIMPSAIIISVMWLGLFFFSIWCGTSDAK